MLYDKLFDWQKNIVNKYKSKNSFGLYLDCGLGKTPLGLAFAEANGCDHILIISINSKAIENEDVKGSWLDWSKEMNIDYEKYNKNSLKKPIEFTENPSILLMNYEGLFERGNARGVALKKSVLDFLRVSKKLAIIIDESHKIKDLQSIQTKALMKIKTLANVECEECHVYLLSGTPFTKGYVDLYSQLKILGCPMTKQQFIDEFCIKDNRPGLLGWQQPIVGYRNLDELYKIIHSYAITMMSDDVVKLPEKTYDFRTFPLTKQFILFTNENAKMDLISAYNKEIKASLPLNGPRNPYYRNIAYPEDKFVGDTSGSFWMRARQLSIGFQGNADESIWFDKTRLKALEKFLEQNQDNYVLFYNYTPELVELYDICSKLGYNVDVYCGEIKSLTFYESYCRLSESQKLVAKNNIILANFQSGSTGMNWQEYNQCIVFSLPVYRDWAQGIKRLHRIGQKSNVIYHIFMQNNWIEKGMWKAIEMEQNYTEKMFEDELEKMKRGYDES